MIGDILHERYHIVDKLGFGGYSTVWLARDTRLAQYVALKVGLADPDSDSLRREIKALQALSAHLPSVSSTSQQQQRQHRGPHSIPVPLDEFEVHGPNGIHPCYTRAPAQCNLREVSYSRLFQLDVARALSGGLALAVAYVHSQGYVHGDIHLRNILLRLPSGFNPVSAENLYEIYGEPETVPITPCNNNDPLPVNVLTKAVLAPHLGRRAEKYTLSEVGEGLLLSDFGEAFKPALGLQQGKDCHTPLAFRVPEAYFEPQASLSYPSDIWSLATAIWEILGMEAIFSLERTDIDKIVSQQVDLMGPLPLHWWEGWERRSQFFNEDRKPTEGRYVWPPIDEAFEEGVQKYRRMDGMGEFGKEETSAILDLMRRMLAFCPEDRPTAEEVLKSEWMAKWALPEFERSLQMR
ncbi:CMGC/SRPK protein kinase [Helicocarpus griseus UAMH5409]|uniref:CMGC/SRPK protein kinase n=1 Tax=Helicocarpus griseus UAMH5409 TaxID=1447875 RepID=A0A2B7Y236_9EURO|nr:CMGC/SRPK protein kinase [Helicocarpus griseus UAMH5409]